MKALDNWDTLYVHDFYFVMIESEFEQYNFFFVLMVIFDAKNKLFNLKRAKWMWEQEHNTSKDIEKSMRRENLIRAARYNSLTK